MPKTVVELALEELLKIQPLSEASGASAASDGHAASCAKKLVQSTAAFCEAIDRERAGNTLRARADLVEKKTAAGTPYDQHRRKFIALFNEDEMEQMGLEPLPWDFGTFKSQFGPSYIVPADLQVVREISAEYTTYVPQLKAAREYRPSFGPGIFPGSELSSNDALPSPEVSEDPNRVARAWIVQLQQLELLAERENFWGSQLILFCRDLRDPSQQIAYMPGFLKSLGGQFDDALAAIKKAAVNVATDKTRLPNGPSALEDREHGEGPPGAESA